MRTRTSHLLFIDESGTHDMVNVDPGFPVFGLVGLLVGEKYYQKVFVPRVKSFKAAHSLSPEIALHSRDIRRREGQFFWLEDTSRKDRFYEATNSLIRELKFRLFAIVIDKARLRDKFVVQVNPYDVSLSQLLSLVCGPPGIPSVYRPSVAKIIAESRGRKEDKQLQREYQGFRGRGLSNYGATEIMSRQAPTMRRVFPDRIDFLRKAEVIAGLELADLLAYPLCRAVVNRDYSNPAYKVASEKLSDLVLFP
jgi:hypothetical protein